jgi:enamine deaminase RidA (YjgF/YER057c/UK114 family)
MIITVSLAAAAVPASHGRSAFEVTMPTDPRLLKVHQDLGFAEAIVVGDTVYLSGVIAGQQPGEETFEPAFERAFADIQSRLARVGASWDDVVQMMTFHTDLAAQMPVFVKVKNRYVRPPFPAWTAIGISRLASPNGLAEIQVTAKLPGPSKRK